MTSPHPPPTPERQIENLATALGAAAVSMPHSAEAETALLGAVLTAQDVLAQLQQLERELAPSDFYTSPARTVYAAMLELYRTGKGVDYVTLLDLLRDRQELDKAGGAPYVVELSTGYSSAFQWPFYVGIVRDKSSLRALIAAAHTMLATALSPVNDTNEAMDVVDIVGQAETAVYEIGEALRRSRAGVTRREFVDHTAVMAQVIEDVQNLSTSLGQILPNRIATGFTDFDRLTGGLARGQFVVVAARPATGKTVLGSACAVHAALGPLVTTKFGETDVFHYRDGVKNLGAKKVAFVSLEMSPEEIMSRHLMGEAGIDVSVLRSGIGLAKGDDLQIVKAYEVLRRANIKWMHTPGISVQELRARLRKLKAQEGLDFLVVDYLQLLKSNTSTARRSRETEVAEVSATLKAIAVELEIPVLALAQLNRESESRTGGKPIVADLRESGSVEQDADIVALIWRPHNHIETAPPEDTVLIIGKHRGGATSEILLNWTAHRARFQSTTTKLHSNDANERQRAIPDYKNAPKSKPTEPPSQSYGKPDYASKNYTGPRGRPPKGAPAPPAEDDF